MSVNRRSVLKGMALGGVTAMAMACIRYRDMEGLAAVGTPAPAHRPVLALTGGGPAEAFFLSGARAVRSADKPIQVARARPDLEFMQEFARQLGSGHSMRIIGLLDDAAAALVVDMARSSGARVQWLGQHTAEAGFTRHRVLNTDSAGGSARQLGRQLHACGAGFSLYEECADSATAPRQLLGPSRSAAPSAQWVAGIGYLLASLGTPTMRAAPMLPAASTHLTGSFVSFSIEA